MIRKNDKDCEHHSRRKKSTNNTTPWFVTPDLKHLKKPRGSSWHQTENDRSMDAPKEKTEHKCNRKLSETDSVICVSLRSSLSILQTQTFLFRLDFYEIFFSRCKFSSSLEDSSNERKVMETNYFVQSSFSLRECCILCLSVLLVLHFFLIFWLEEEFFEMNIRVLRENFIRQ